MSKRLDEVRDKLLAEDFWTLDDPEDARRLVQLMSDDWLRRKLDYERRIKEHAAYLRQYAPWFEDLTPGLVIDLGPGGGELLVLARAMGHSVAGIDALSGEGGMGDAYLEASKLLTKARNLPVYYDGVFRHVDGNLQFFGDVAFVNSRGSLEQIFSDYMDGPPHDRHHMATHMHWRLNDRLTREAMRDLFVWVERQLRPGASFLCHLNGSNNTAEAERMLDRTAMEAGLIAQQIEPRVHIWSKENAT